MIKINMNKSRETSANKFQLNSLDGLRGLAVLFVFLSYTSNTGVYLRTFKYRTIFCSRHT